jgi:hypothetical protein
MDSYSLNDCQARLQEKIGLAFLVLGVAFRPFSSAELDGTRARIERPLLVPFQIRAIIQFPRAVGATECWLAIR